VNITGDAAGQRGKPVTEHRQNACSVAQEETCRGV